MKNYRHEAKNEYELNIKYYSHNNGSTVKGLLLTIEPMAREPLYLGHGW